MAEISSPAENTQTFNLPPKAARPLATSNVALFYTALTEVISIHNEIMAYPILHHIKVCVTINSRLRTFNTRDEMIDDSANNRRILLTLWRLIPRAGQVIIATSIIIFGSLISIDKIAYDFAVSTWVAKNIVEHFDKNYLEVKENIEKNQQKNYYKEGKIKVNEQCAQCPVLYKINNNEYNEYKISHLVTVGDYKIFKNAILLIQKQESYIEKNALSICHDASGNRVANATWRERYGQILSETTPLGCVTWSEAMEYVEWLARVSGKPFKLPSALERRAANSSLPDATIRLPGQAEWLDGCADEAASTGACSLRPALELAINGGIDQEIASADSSRNIQLGFRVILKGASK